MVALSYQHPLLLVLHISLAFARDPDLHTNTLLHLLTKYWVGIFSKQHQSYRVSFFHLYLLHHNLGKNHFDENIFSFVSENKITAKKFICSFLLL
jgi:hypothetical protein